MNLPSGSLLDIIKKWNIGGKYPQNHRQLQAIGKIKDSKINKK